MERPHTGAAGDGDGGGEAEGGGGQGAHGTTAICYLLCGWRVSTRLNRASSGLRADGRIYNTKLPRTIGGDQQAAGAHHHQAEGEAGRGGAGT